jgi:hypothetical protein
MSPAEEYLQRTAECHHEAKRAITPLDKQHWLRLAERWQKLVEANKSDPQDH